MSSFRVEILISEIPRQNALNHKYYDKTFG